MKCNSDYHADICTARRRNGDCVSEYPCRHKVEPPQQKTNADHIRYMTDEELAGFLSPSFSCYGCPARPFCEKDEAGTDCNELVANWLKQPYEEDNT